MKKPVVLLKLSGETLASCFGGNYFSDNIKRPSTHPDKKAGPIDPLAIKYVINEIKLAAPYAFLGIVVGGGNIWRGGRQDFIDRAAADYAGMCATLINALVLKEALSSSGISAAAVAPLALRIPYFEDDSASHTRKLLAQGNVVIFAGGTGKPFFTTDTAAALRALEIKAALLVKATQVDGIYDKDPVKNSDAIRYKHLTYDEAIRKKLAIMDSAAFDLCRQGKIPIVVYNFYTKSGLKDVIIGRKKIGTIVTD